MGEAFPIFLDTTYCKSKAVFENMKCTSLKALLLLIPGVLVCLLLPSSLIVSFTLLLVDASNAANEQDRTVLTSESVVLITGAASHLGSQLAISLYKTYNVSKLILIDDLSINDIYLPTNHLSNLDNQFEDKPSTKDRKRSESSLAAFESKRQRIFHVLQTVEDRGYFYRVDFRPVLPEYSETKTTTEMGIKFLGLPVLDMIFNTFDISHVIHMDENILNSNVTQVVPRKREDDRMGMMDGLLEQLKNSKEEQAKVPHFVYASSYEIYSDDVGDKREDWDISFTPNQSLKGTSKLLDEILANSYRNLYGIPSIGLRFFEVYGPWSSPESKIFDLAERTVNHMSILHSKIDSEDIFTKRDYIYIDDAVDTILSAMQFRAPSRDDLVINVGTGQGSSLADIALNMETLWPRSFVQDQVTNVLKGLETSSPRQSSYVASTERSSNLLNFQPQVSLLEGMEKTVAWHYDRSIGFNERATFNKSGLKTRTFTSDVECTHDLKVFPCLSECAQQRCCVPSVYDNAATISKAMTQSCETVMYTILLHKDTATIPSTFANLTSDDNPSVAGKMCNIAFVNEESEFMARMKQRNGIGNEVNYEDRLISIVRSGRDISESDLIRFGFWIILPVTVVLPETNFGSSYMLPKLSPSSFFSSKYALYCDSNVAIRDTRKVIGHLHAVEKQLGSSIAFMIGANRIQAAHKEKQFCSAASFNQERIYNTIHLTLNGYADQSWTLSSSWILHSLSSDAARDVRCDIQGEIVGWKVLEDNESIDLILMLHDFWSCALGRWKGQGEWWKWKGDFGENFAIMVEGERSIARAVSSEEMGIILVDE